METIQAEKIMPSREEVLRYLGYKGQEISSQLEEELSQCIQRVHQEAAPRCICQRFPLKKETQGIAVEGTSLLLTGQDIAHLLAGSEECVLLAATLGGQVERLINYTQQLSVTKALIMDSAATAMIEGICDAIENQLRIQVEKEGKALTWRYSCGYGDLPLSLQKDFLSALEAQRKIGLTCSKDFIMLPRKSVTAVMGIGKAGKKKSTDCTLCPYHESCNLRKAGRSCGR